MSFKSGTRPGKQGWSQPAVSSSGPSAVEKKRAVAQEQLKSLVASHQKNGFESVSGSSMFLRQPDLLVSEARSASDTYINTHLNGADFNPFG